MAGEKSKVNINITSSAAKKVATLLSQNPGNDALRIYVEGGGCSGMRYGFAFENLVEEGDITIEKDGVKFIVDSISANYLDGASVDYVEDLMSSSFNITNPNATGTCGCGSSFAV